MQAVSSPLFIGGPEGGRRPCGFQRAADLFGLCFVAVLRKRRAGGRGRGVETQLNLFKMIFLIKVSSRGIVGQVDSNHFRKTEPVISLFCSFSKSKGS